jgi:hypothetical protein
MRASIRGWGRDHGEKELINTRVDEMSEIDEGARYSWGRTYLNIMTKPFKRRVRVSAGTKLNLNGSYLLQVELSNDEIALLYRQTRGHYDIARLFYRTFREQDLGYIVRLLASFKEEEEAEHKAAAASSEPEAA